jgi:hypothetical protein
MKVPAWIGVRTRSKAGPDAHVCITSKIISDQKLSVNGKAVSGPLFFRFSKEKKRRIKSPDIPIIPGFRTQHIANQSAVISKLRSPPLAPHLDR